MFGGCKDVSLTRPSWIRDPPRHVLGMTMSVLMGVTVPLLFPEDLPREIFFSMGVHIDFGRGDPATYDARNLQPSSDIQRL